MDPQTQFCHNPTCPARGQVGQDNIVIHSQKERRYRCKTCDKTFSATKGTPFYRLQTAVEVVTIVVTEVVTIVVTLLCHGCPIQVIVAAFGFDERTVARWFATAGLPLLESTAGEHCQEHCQKVHEHLVQQGQVDLQHVQADELWVKLVGSRVWMAMAVPTRLWLGGVISPQRDLVLITSVVKLVRSCGQRLTILVCVDGLASYVSAFLRVFREPVRTGGRPRLVLEEGFMLGQSLP